MIKKLKTKFITLATASLFVLLAVVVAGMCTVNYFNTLRELDFVLDILSENKGSFPGHEHGRPQKLPSNISPELPYQSRYFSVTLDSDGRIKEVDISRIAAIDKEEAAEYALNIFEKSSTRGFADTYRYIKTDESQNTRVIFLDASRQIDSLKSFIISAVTVSAVGMVLVFIAIVFYSGRIIRPLAESYEKQKRFITDAGHEIKTPLTIINANIDLIEMEYGQNDYTDEIHRQTKRLTNLTNDLVYLAKMEETRAEFPMTDVPVSDIVSETAQSFGALARAQNKQLFCDVESGLIIKGNPHAITELVSILLDNALKYSGENGRINVGLTKTNKNVCLNVFNTTAEQLPKEGLHLLFERFYRADPSRNSGTGGHGLGLSIAQAIVQAHGGKLQAVSADGFSLLITITFNQ